MGFLVLEWASGEGEVGDRIEILMAACDCLCLVDASLQAFQQQVSAVDCPEVHAAVPLSLTLRFTVQYQVAAVEDSV